MRFRQHDPFDLATFVPVGDALLKQDLGNCSLVDSSRLQCVTPTRSHWWHSPSEMVPRVSEQLSVEVSIDDTRYNERVQFSSNSSKTFFLFTDFALGMNASLSRFALQLSNIGLADFGYTAQLAFRSAVATSIGSNFTHDAVTIESFALASSAWDADSATRRPISTPG